MANNPSNKKTATVLFGAVAVFIAILIIAFTYYVNHVQDPGKKNPDPIKSGP